jgi:hypothetical protein
MGDVGERAAMDEGRVASSVCTRLGLIASFSSTAIAPAALRSPAVTGFRSRVSADDDAAEAGLRSSRSVRAGRRSPSPRRRR